MGKRKHYTNLNCIGFMSIPLSAVKLQSLEHEVFWDTVFFKKSKHLGPKQNCF